MLPSFVAVATAEQCCAEEPAQPRSGGSSRQPAHDSSNHFTHFARDLSRAMHSSFFDGLDLPASIWRGGRSELAVSQRCFARTMGVFPDKSFTSRLAPASQTWEWSMSGGESGACSAACLLNLRQVRLRSGKQQQDIHRRNAGCEEHG
jgi:hypothetical protein